MDMTGNDMPQMLKEIMPQSEAKESPKRRVGSMANMKTPSPWQPMMNNHITPHNGRMPPAQGKFRNT